MPSAGVWEWRGRRMVAVMARADVCEGLRPAKVHRMKERPMELTEQINPGVCGFDVVVTAQTEDGRHVTFAFETECDIIQEFERRLGEISPVDALQTLSPEENPVLALAREQLRTTGCCEACVVPVGAVKAMYVVANLALARDVSLTLTAEK